MKQEQNAKRRALPSKRPKKRYVLFRVMGGHVHFANVRESVLSHLKSFFGPEFESARIMFVFFDSGSGFGFLKCGHKAAQKVRKALLSAKVSGFLVEPVRTSGSLARLKAIASSQSRAG
ncbi:MAG: hypothetical protein HY392_01715 [Candidatus Diapherotrites archaeon]|nr:hypothetical protein [Candidatus Diapherotrites archaeon]